MLKTLSQWLTDDCGLVYEQLELLPGDASFRQYSRVYTRDQSYIAMNASVEKHTCIPFVAISNTLRNQGICAPEVFKSDMAQGYLLLSDLGQRTYLQELNTANAFDLYCRALDVLLRMQKCKTVKGWSLKSFDVALMCYELNLFKEWFLEKHLGLVLTETAQQLLTKSFLFLAEIAAQQPQVFMHRDYHSANLMYLANDQVGVLDFQDAFIGPITYDLVSLLRDCYVAWPETMVTELVNYFWQQSSVAQSAEEFLRWFDLMGIQRHLKALLTFSRKYQRDGNANYLTHIPRTLNYILSVSQRYAECQELYHFLQDTVVEKCVA